MSRDIVCCFDCRCTVISENALWRMEYCPQHAAAPELLKALESLFHWLRAHAEHKDEFFLQSMMQAEAAIRKAKGD